MSTDHKTGQVDHTTDCCVSVRHGAKKILYSEKYFTLSLLHAFAEKDLQRLETKTMMPAQDFLGIILYVIF